METTQVSLSFLSRLKLISQFI